MKRFLLVVLMVFSFNVLADDIYKVDKQYYSGHSKHDRHYHGKRHDHKRHYHKPRKHNHYHRRSHDRYYHEACGVFHGPHYHDNDRRYHKRHKPRKHRDSNTSFTIIWSFD